MSVRLLQLRTISRTTPQKKAKEWVPISWLKVLAAHLNLPSFDLTIAEFWSAIARLGGFIGRAGDGFCGWQT